MGVKNQWVHTFLSTAYLTSLSIAVLIVYVISPPISDAIQGAYFVGIFMTGLMFGAGALIFKEVTEGLGCLLGGFCLSMWFLTLKDGGLVTNAAGKGIFIGIFCVVVWSLSFSHHTRVYGLIGSTAVSGATSFVLGIDCFSRAGLKEFWVYIWALNNDLFPLGVTTYPITRGIRVETIVIVLGTLIGIMSQVKLWKIVRAKQRRRDEAKQDNQRRKEVVEEALGRHIERQNDKDRANWERQYGDRLEAKRSTILWSKAHPDKSYTHIATREVYKPSRSSSSESLELTAGTSKRIPSSYSARNKRASTTAVDVIPEEQEDPETRASMERRRALTALEREKSSETVPSVKRPRSARVGPEVVPLPFKVPAGDSNLKSELVASGTIEDPILLQEPRSAPERKSLQSLLSLSSRLSTDLVPTSESQEALALPSPLHSRPSSLAATCDEDNDRAALYNLNRVPSNEPQTPHILISPAGSTEDLEKGIGGLEHLTADVRDVPPSPPALSVDSELDDPEELTRLTVAPPADKHDASTKDKRLSKETKTSTATEEATKQSSDTYAQSHLSTGQTSTADGLTKGALNQVPSQLSNVVMSYRTNEWAKHISTAEAPMFDEPHEVEGLDPEPVTQLAPPSLTSPTSSLEPAVNSSKSLEASSKPPPPHVISATSDGNETTHARAPQRSASDIELAQAVTSIPSRSPSIQSPEIGADPNPAPAAPVRFVSVQSGTAPLTKGKRKSQNGNKKQSLAATPIDENEPTVFASAPAAIEPTSVGKQSRMNSTSSSAGRNLAGITRASSASGTNTFSRSSSYTSLAEIQRLSRTSSKLSQGPAMRSDTRLDLYHTSQSNRSPSVLHNVPAMMSETRLDSYNSRQPQRRDISDNTDRRKNLLAEWRMSQQHGGLSNGMPKQQLDSRRAQMLLDKEHTKLTEEQQKAAQQQKQVAIDQVMRRPDMQDLHREAMRKMQAKTKV